MLYHLSMLQWRPEAVTAEWLQEGLMWKTGVQFCSPNWPGSPKLSYIWYSWGSAVIKFIHREGWWAKMKISGEKGRLSVPLFLSPLLQPACLLLFAVCLVVVIRLTSHNAHTHWGRHCTNTAGAAFPTLQGCMTWDCINGYNRAQKVQRGDSASQQIHNVVRPTEGLTQSHAHISFPCSGLTPSWNLGLFERHYNFGRRFSSCPGWSLRALTSLFKLPEAGEMGFSLVFAFLVKMPSYICWPCWSSLLAASAQEKLQLSTPIFYLKWGKQREHWGKDPAFPLPMPKHQGEGTLHLEAPTSFQWEI